jgi:hypothetical protein
MPEKDSPTLTQIKLATTNDVNRIEAPVTWKAYLMCAFATFGGIFYGYDSGYINGVSGSKLFVEAVEGKGATLLSSSNQSLIVSILSGGTFFGEFQRRHNTPISLLSTWVQALLWPVI